MAVLTRTILGKAGVQIDTFSEVIAKYTKVLPLSLDEIKEIASNTLKKIRDLKLTDAFNSKTESGLAATITALGKVEREFQISTWFKDISTTIKWDDLINGKTPFSTLDKALDSSNSIIKEAKSIFPNFDDLTGITGGIDKTVNAAFLDANGALKSEIEILAEQFGKQGLQDILKASEVLEVSSKDIQAIAEISKVSKVLGGLGKAGNIIAFFGIVIGSFFANDLYQYLVGPPLKWSDYSNKPIKESFVAGWLKYINNSANRQWGLFGSSREEIENGFWQAIQMMVKDCLRTYTTQYVPSIELFIANNLALKQLSAYVRDDSYLLNDAQKKVISDELNGVAGLLAQHQDIKKILDETADKLEDIFDESDSRYHLSAIIGSFALVFESILFSGNKIFAWIKQCFAGLSKITSLYETLTTLIKYALGEIKKNQNDFLFNGVLTLPPIIPPRVPDSTDNNAPERAPDIPATVPFPRADLGDLLSPSIAPTVAPSIAPTKTDTKPKRFKFKKPKFKDKKSKKKTKKTINNKSRIQFIDVDVSSYSEWLQYITFEFDTRVKLDSNKRGTVNIITKKNKFYKIGRFKRGVFSNSVITTRGAGFGYWRNFRYKDLVNKNTVSYNLPRPTLLRQIKAISKEIEMSNVTYK